MSVRIVNQLPEGTDRRLGISQDFTAVCPKCRVRRAIRHEIYGLTECLECRRERQQIHRGPEFTSDSIQEQRLEYKKDILQPYRNGILSREYLEEYGTSGITVSEEEQKKSEYTWKDTKGWWNREKGAGGRPEEWQGKNISQNILKNKP